MYKIEIKDWKSDKIYKISILLICYLDLFMENIF